MRRSVLVTDAGRGSAIAFMRSLGQRGWHVIAADADAHCPGFRARHVAERWVVPDPKHAPQAFVEFLLQRLRAQPVDLLVPITDECIHPLAHARERFAGLTQLAIAPAEALATATDKRATLELARRLGLPVPPTREVCGVDEARAAAAELGYPLVLKPAVSRRYLPDRDRIEKGAVCFARDERELEARLARLLEHHAVLLQRYEHGVGVGVEAIARDGRILRAFQHRRLAEIPVTGGASAWRESVPLDPALFAHAQRLIEALRWTGLVMVEFKLGREPWLIEVNGRVWGSLPLACHSGVDFPALLAELHYPGTAPAEAAEAVDAPYRVGVRAYNLELMLSWIAQVLIGAGRRHGLPYPTRPQALAGLAGLLDPAQKSDLGGSRDFALRLAEVGHITRKFARKLAHAEHGSNGRNGHGGGAS